VRTVWVSAVVVPTLIFLLGVLVACPVQAQAQAVQKWMTPSGSLYLGDTPPPGSTLLGVVGEVKPSARSERSNDSDVGGTTSNGYVVPVVFLVFLAAIAIQVAFVLHIHRSPTSDVGVPWPFYFQRPLSHPEQELYFRLRNALPDLIVLTRVRLSRFLGVKSGHWFFFWKIWITGLSVDFLVCSKDASVLAAIELDNGNHEFERRQTMGGRIDRALSSAKVRLVRWKSEVLPDEDTIRRDILGAEAAQNVAARRARAADA
jgi:Protein of unknown function (DUF2726)